MKYAALILTHLLHIALAAHFLREGNLALMALALGVLGLLWTRRPWAIVLTQVQLAAGALIWLGTAGEVLEKRVDAGRPYARMLAILGTVAALSLLCAVLWALPRVRQAWLRATA